MRTLCEAVGTYRDRPILLHAIVNHPGTCGLWVPAAKADYIFYERDTSPLHQAHIVLHELSHLLCGHRSGALSQGELGRLLLPDLPGNLVQGVLPRSAYLAEEEREAELLASLILERVARRNTPRPMEPDVASLLERLKTVLTESPQADHE